MWGCTMWMRVEYSDGYIRWFNLARVSSLAINPGDSTLAVADGVSGVLVLSISADDVTAIRLIQDESGAMSLLWRDLDRASKSEAQG
jgi:hypothetical protein